MFYRGRFVLTRFFICAILELETAGIKIGGIIMKVSSSYGNELILTLEENDRVRLTTSADTCIYLEVSDGKLELTGGADIIKKISGPGMSAKVTE